MTVANDLDGKVIARGLWHWIHDCVNAAPDAYFQTHGLDAERRLTDGEFWDNALTYLEGQHRDTRRKYQARIALVGYLQTHGFRADTLFS